MQHLIEKTTLGNLPPIGKRSYGLEVVIDPEKCTGCGVCSMECPSRIIDMVPAASGCEARISACTDHCLSGNDMKYALYQMKNGASAKSVFELIAQINPFPAITGRICSHPCEENCNRKHLDQAINLHDFERYIGDLAIDGHFTLPVGKKDRPEKIAVVGGGPSGLACAYFLRKQGYMVTVFEASEKAGGVLRYGIPSYRVPASVVEAEIQRIIAAGVELRTGVDVGTDVSLEQLSREYNAVYIAGGRRKVASLGVSGEELTISALQFLKSLHEDSSSRIEGNVVVVGGGNVALDAARWAKKRGASSVTIVSLEKYYEMPASNDEINAAREEGLLFLDGRGVEHLEQQDGQIQISFRICVSLRDENGRFSPSYESCDEKLTADLVIAAVGQATDLDWTGKELVHEGERFVFTDKKGMTRRSGVFAGGDITAFANAGTVAGNIADGRKAAEHIHEYLTGEGIQKQAKSPLPADSGFADYHDPKKRREKITWEDALWEAKRCLHCGTQKASYRGKADPLYFNRACQNCHNCVSVCESKAVSFRYFKNL